MAMTDKKDIIKGSLTGRAFYPWLNRPQHDDENNRDDYKVTLVLTNEEGQPIIVKDKKTGETVNMVERAKELNLNVKEASKSIPGKHVKITRNVKTKDDGTKTLPPEVKDKNGKDLSAVNVGNESLVKVEFSGFPIVKGVAKGKNSAYLNKVVVYKLVEYISQQDEDEFEFPEDMMGKEDNLDTSNGQAIEVDIDED